MSAPHADQIIDGYTARLGQALADVPAGPKGELLEDVRQHIAQARAGLTDETDADLLNMLDRLGDPAELAAAAAERPSAQPVATTLPPGLLEIAAIVALVLVWPAGIALVWLSSVWSRRDKLVATVLIPASVVGLASLGVVGGYFAHFFVLAMVLLIYPVVWSIGAIYLGVRLYQMRQAGAGQAEQVGSSRATTLNIFALVLNAVFWPVGVILLWKSDAWIVRDKLIGTFGPPGGYLGVAIILRLMTASLSGAAACSGYIDAAGNVTSLCSSSGPPAWWPRLAGIVGLILLVLPLLTAAYLAVRLRAARTLKAAVAL